MGITVKCYRDNGDKEGGSISAPLCTSEKLAKMRGKRYLDDPEQGNYYQTTKRRFSLPHKVMLKTEDFVTIQSQRLDKNSVMSYKCLSYTLVITKNSVTASGEFISYGT